MNKKIWILSFVSVLTFQVKGQELPECLEDVGDKQCLMKIDGMYGIIDKKGKYIVPAYFDTIEVYGKGFIVKQNDKFGVIDRKGKIMIPIEFNGIKCAGNCDEDILFEITGQGVKSIFISKDQNQLFGYNTVSPLLFASQTEITLSDWFSFVSDVKENGYNYNFGYESVLPDTNFVEEKLRPAYRSLISAIQNEEKNYYDKKIYGYFSSWKNEYYYTSFLVENKLTSMLNFPVTGITHEQATKYCNWLTTIFANQVNIDNKLTYEIKFRLPKLDEWEAMANSGLNEEMKKNKCHDSLNKEGCMLINYKSSTSCKNYDDYLKNSFGVGSTFNVAFWPDLNGLYNLYGNVAEMLFENGVAKGGSYFHSAKMASYDYSIEYEKAEPWLGFRVVAELVKKKD